MSYANWKRSFEEVKLYENYLKNALIRYKGVTELIVQGDKPAIDSVEAGISVTTRRLNLEDAQLKYTKARLELSNYLWYENNLPLELKEELQPEKTLSITIKETLQVNELSSFSLDNHPKIKALDAKIDLLKVEKQLKANALCPN